MAKSKPTEPKADPPAAPPKPAATPAKPPAPPKPPADRHGPQGPVQLKPYGVAHLRRVLELSPAVSVEELAEEAALRIEQAPEPTPHRPGEDTSRRENLASML